MKKKRLIILLILLLVAIAFFFYDRYGNRILPIKLDADKIEEIEILSNYWDEESEKSLTFNSKDDVEIIAKISELFNNSIKHQNQGVGTTLTTSVRIIYSNGNEISFRCGVGNFITVARNSKQYNYVNGELDEYIAVLLGDLTSSEKEFVSKRVEQYTINYFRFMENVEVDTEYGKTTVSVSFVPEVGSIVIKEELYEIIATHAYQITEFFPEVKKIDYIILSPEDNLKEEVLYLTINEEAIGNLEVNYLNQLNRKYYDNETQFIEVFSEIIETEESGMWRDRVDPNSVLP